MPGIFRSIRAADLNGTAFLFYGAAVIVEQNFLAPLKKGQQTYLLANACSKAE